MKKVFILLIILIIIAVPLMNSKGTLKIKSCDS